MATAIRFNALDTASVNSAISELQQIRSEQNQKVQDACMQLAEIGKTRANADFASVPYDGVKDYSLTVEPIENGARLVASSAGETINFLEYGAGALNPPYLGVDPYGRGSWSEGPSGKGHWKDPNGWYYAHGKKSWGNPPAAALYHAEQAMREYAPQIVNGAPV